MSKLSTANIVREGPSIEQILLPTENHHKVVILPGEQTPDKRSRWWRNHKRSRSSEPTPTPRRLSNISNASEGKKLTRSNSVDRRSISTPRKESIEESKELQQMLVRIKEMSASSPGKDDRGPTFVDDE